jgi:hypothetical protein
MTPQARGADPDIRERDTQITITGRVTVRRRLGTVARGAGEPPEFFYFPISDESVCVHGKPLFPMRNTMGLLLREVRTWKKELSEGTKAASAVVTGNGGSKGYFPQEVRGARQRSASAANPPAFIVLEAHPAHAAAPAWHRRGLLLRQFGNHRLGGDQQAHHHRDDCWRQHLKVLNPFHRSNRNYGLSRCRM